ncbi:MAG: sulfatase-like hydrolase/transferase [Aureispira sp.]|nr:sulfatase-like hydrolase/transferase [Aureispira sp.]
MQKRLKTEVHYAKLLLQRLAIVYLMYAIVRFVFYWYNQNAFGSLGGLELLSIFFYALRFDTSSIFYVNFLFIVLHVLPTKQREHSWYKRLQKVVFYAGNSTIIFFELVDTVYFPYSFKRMTGNEFEMGSDLKNLAPQFLKEFWWLLLVAGLIVVLMEWLYRKTEQKQLQEQPKLLGQTLVLVLMLGISIIGLRGGLQVRPVVPLMASKYVNDMRQMPLVSNTILSMIHTWNTKKMVPKVYFDEAEQKQFFDFYRPTVDTSVSRMKKKNVMIVVMESFGQEYVGWFGQQKPSRTPFFDSLINQGLLFKNAHANGLRSTEGITAVLAGIPALMNEHYIFSPYNGNKIDGLGTLLEREGYQTSFFHGGHIGTMDFDKFLPILGFKDYHGHENYVEATGKSDDYDGNWGTFDMPFFDYTIKELSSKHKEPFVSVLFSINPHHPYRVPDDFECDEEDPIWCAVRYADMAYRQFWEDAKKQPWFENTLFVFTADHIGTAIAEMTYQRERCFRIPILFHAPSDSSLKGVREDIMQQIDIIPTTLDYLNYPHDFKTFGISQFDESIKRKYAYARHEEVYQIINDSLILFFNGKNSVNMANYKKDTFFSYNLIKKMPKEFKLLEQTLKSIIQTHDHALVNNQLK